MNLYGIARPLGFAASVVVIICGVAACSSDDKETSSSSSGGANGTSGSSGNSGSNGSSGNSSSSGSSGEGCTGEITSCPMGSLSDDQAADMCSVFLTAIDSPPGTKYECDQGPNQGLSITVNTKEQCLQQRPAKTCKVTVGEMVECFKAARADACAAFDGACSVLFEQDNGCS